jgi:hypothetical protein
MGLGKTVQALAFLQKLRKTKPKARNLLVVPTTLMENGQWEKGVWIIGKLPGIISQKKMHKIVHLF